MQNSIHKIAYIKISKDWLAKYYQKKKIKKNKERLQKKLAKDIKVFLKKVWKYAREWYKILPEYENQKLVKYIKNIINEKKHLILIILNYYFKK